MATITYDTWGGSWGTSWDTSWTRTVSTGDTHDGDAARKRADEAAAKRDAEIKESRDRLRSDLLAAVERVTGKQPPLDAPLKQLASIARRSESFDYRGTLAAIAELDRQVAETRASREREAADARRREEEDFIVLTMM